MAEKWQRWMPFHIDKFRGSPEVQAMHPAARLGYIYLLASSWQTDDCTVSSDPLDLATESGLGDEMWAIYGPRIVRKFELHEGRLRNCVLYCEWLEAKTTYEGRRERAKRIQETKRTPHRDDIVTTSKRYADTVTDTETLTLTKKQKQKHPQAAFDLPDWVDRKAWDGFEALRKRGGKRTALDDSSRALCVRKLESLRRAGHDPTEVLNQSVMNGYQGLFEVKGGSNGSGQQNGVTQRVDAATQRQGVSRDAISEAGRRRYGGATVAVDDPGASVQTQPDLTPRNAGYVPAGVGGNVQRVRDGTFKGRTLEGTP